MSYVTDGPIPWPVPADWKNGVREQLAWLTDVIPSRAGDEQKRELRLAPRRTFTFDTVADDQARRVADALLFDQGGKVYALPIWHDVQLLASAVALGDTVIPCRTDDFEFEVGGRVMLWASVNSFEILPIESIAVDGLTVSLPLAQDWPIGARLYPVRDARNLDAAEESALSDTIGNRKLTFVIDEPCDWPAILPATLYRAYPVLEHHADQAGDPTSSYVRSLDLVDASSGPVSYFDYVDAPFRMASHRWLLESRAEHGAFRSLLYGLRGRMAAVWIPSMSADLVMATAIASAATALVIEWAGYTLYGRQQSNRRDLRIELLNGTVLYRRVTASSEGGDNTETLTLNAAPGQNIAPSQVRLISFMSLSSLAGDTVEIDHVTDADGITRSAVSFKALKHGI